MVRPLLAASLLVALLLAPRAAWALDGDAAPVCTDVGEAMNALVASLAPQDAPPLDDNGNVPWCITADDPRCSPMDGGSLPSQTTTQPKLALGSLLQPRGPSVLEPERWQPTAADGAIRAGEYLRLERPPR